MIRGNLFMSITMNAVAIDLYGEVYHRLNVVEDDIIKFCQRWKIVEFGVFGSVLRDDFRCDSDVDVLVTFDAKIQPRLVDRLDMQEEIEALFHRPVDMVQRCLLKNPYMRSEILRSCLMIYIDK
jgi:predicted nucleotidyltransferase